MEYLEQVAKLEAEDATVESGSERERMALERFQGLLSDFKAPDFRERVSEVYAEELFFNDTLKTIRSSAELEEYLAASADAVEVGTVEFLDWVESSGNYYVRWKMDLEFKRFARGRLTSSSGMSHIRFDREGRVVLHQDFWDSAGGLFEHLPAVGWMIRRVKAQL